MPIPKGKGYLTGPGDGAQPGWQERTKARVNNSQTEKLRRANRSRGSRMGIDCDPRFVVLVKEAARSRGMGLNGYMRRAIAAFVAHDLGMTFEEVCSNFASPYRQGQMLKKDDERSLHLKKGLTHDDGAGFGTWEVK